MSSLNNPPNGGEVRQPDAKAKPWQALGISRATYYRKGKPEKMPSIRWKQADRARVGGGLSIRTIQRADFVRRYGIGDLYYLAHLYGSKGAPSMGMLEEVAKWSHERQRRFMELLLVEAGVPMPSSFSWLDESDREKAEHAPMAFALILLGKYHVRRAAGAAFWATVREMVQETRP
jgi:hypothetical protein